MQINIAEGPIWPMVRWCQDTLSLCLRVKTALVHARRHSWCGRGSGPDARFWSRGGQTDFYCPHWRCMTSAIYVLSALNDLIYLEVRGHLCNSSMSCFRACSVDRTRSTGWRTSFKLSRALFLLRWGTFSRTMWSYSIGGFEVTADRRCKTNGRRCRSVVRHWTFYIVWSRF